ncbi:voltage-dependent T-type calcium channel subunit alpha-1I isoform X2 [Trachinotus anak]|uniref:voltage-dependent T-type calcium channel subunit alpha-1I isoform X2 n=1 Tax=Trachinotus anak TaxID=443729 RepID=UPI0039F1AE33
MAHCEGQRGKQQEVALNIPVEEVCIQKGVSAKGELPYPHLAPQVAFCLKQTTTPRNWCLKITCSPWLDYVSILVILLNCVYLGIYSPCEKRSLNMQVLDAFSFTYFTVEMLIKMVALGVFGYKGSYLSNNWNKFDVFILSGEVLDHFMASLGIKIHVCHVLRLMRLVNRVPSMRDLVTILLDTLPMLANVLVLYIFVMLIFGIVGVQMWAGQLRNRCFLGEDVLKNYNVSLSPYFVSKYGERSPFICSHDHNNGMRRCHDVPPYVHDEETCSSAVPNNSSAASELSVPVLAVAGAGASSCVNWNLYYNVCRAGDHNPNMDAVSFDNIGYALIVVFQVVSLEGWTEIMFYVMDAHSFWSFIFFILVTIMGSFIMMNVCAVVIATQFSESMTRKTRQRRASPVTKLHRQLISWLKTMLRRYIRRRKRVHPRGSKSKSSGVLGQTLMPFRRKLGRLIDSKYFDRVIMLAVFLSILTIAMEHHGQPKEVAEMLMISNIIFTLIFVVELVLKLLVLTWAYFKDQNNNFDFVIVVVSLWEIIAKADGRLSVLRAFRLLRFVRLLHFLPYLKRQLLVLKTTMKEGALLCWLLLLVTIIFSVIGMCLFGGKFTFVTQNGGTIKSRMNFDSLLWSMVTVFQILTEEDWNLVLYDAVAATSPWAFFYFFAIIVVGKHVLLNVLVGIVVKSFQAMHSSDSDQDSSSSSPSSQTSESDSSQTENDESNVSLTYDEHCPPSSCGSKPPTVISSALTDTSNDKVSSTHDEHCPPSSCWSKPPTVIGSAPTDTNNDNKSWSSVQRALHWCRQHEDWSFFVLSPQNRFRIFCQRVICHTVFDNVILLFILLSCVTIAMERPGIDPTSTERRILNLSNYVFSAVFMIEMLFKVLALGLVYGKDSYCRSSWNTVDGLLVILSFVDIIVSLASTGKNNKLGILKVLRLLRTLRPLRVVKRAPKLKLAVEALMASVKPIGNIVLICCAFFFFYGILGVQLFKGKFYHCVGEDIRNITTKTECLSADYLWVRKEYNFDSVPQALMALFVMYSKDGWVNIMFDGLDAVAVDRQPVRNHNKWMVFFFISFMMMSFFLLDMFIGVMVDTFHQCQQEQKRCDEREEEGEALKDQVRDTESEQMPYYTNYTPVRRFIHSMCMGNTLDHFMTITIVISVFIMALEHYRQPLYIQNLTEYCYYLFTTILIIEVLLKLVAFGIWRFLTVRWNQLDLTVVFVSITSIILSKMKMKNTIPINPSILRVCRALRLAQVLKAKKIRVLLKTIIKTLSQVGNICLLFMFFFFIYAVLGVELFGNLECSEDHPCLGLHRYFNFKHFGMALLTLYQVCTGDNWSGILKDTLRECRPDDAGCLSYLSWASPIFFTSFVITAQFVLVNLVVAAIMQALEDSKEEENMLDAEAAPQSPEESVRYGSGTT